MSIEAMKLALDALETECDIYREHDEDGAPEYILEAITALKERLLEASMREVQRLGQEIEQEPVAWRLNGESSFGHGKVFGDWKSGNPPADVTDLISVDKNWSLEFAYTTPPQRTEQEPVATLEDLEQEIYQNTRNFVSRDVMEWMLKRYYTTPPQHTEQEPVAWGWAIMHSDGTKASVRPRIVDFFGCIQEKEPFTSEDAKRADQEWAGLAPHTIVTLYTTPPQRTEQEHDPLPRACNLAGVDYQTFLKIKAYMPAYDTTTPPQRTWVGLTDEDMPTKELDAFCRGARWADTKLKQKNGYAEEKT